MKKLNIQKTFLYFFAILLGLVALFPIYWMFLTSSLPTDKLFISPPKWFPNLMHLDVYKNLWQYLPLSRWLRNTTVIALGTTLISLILSIFAAYSLSRRRFRGKSAISFVFFSTQMLPEALLLIPLYSLFIALGLINSLFGLILANTAFTMPIIVWILKGAIDTVPIELEEAAIIDGCTSLRIQKSIIWPLITPSIVASAVMAFFQSWNEYLFATTFILNPDKQAASTGLATLIGELTTPLDRVMAGALIYTMPPLIFFLLIQKRIVSGLAAGSVKG